MTGHLGVLVGAYPEEKPSAISLAGDGGWAVAMGLLRLALTSYGDWELERAVPPRGHFTVFVLRSLKKPFGWYFTFQRSERRFIIASFPKCLKTGFKGLSLGFGWKEE